MGHQNPLYGAVLAPYHWFIVSQWQRNMLHACMRSYGVQCLMLSVVNLNPVPRFVRFIGICKTGLHSLTNDNGGSIKVVHGHVIYTQLIKEHVSCIKKKTNSHIKKTNS